MRVQRKGLSTVVTTLIIVLLVLAAIGIIWGPVKNLLSSGTSQLGNANNCLNLNVQATKVVNVSATGAYNVTLRRDSGGSYTGPVGAKLIFYSNSGNSQTIEFPGGASLKPLDVVTQTVTTPGNFTNASKVEVTPFYVDASTGDQTLCSTSTTFSFQL